MLQVRSIVLRGRKVDDASVTFGDGANILAGASDTGKSYLVHCLDYILGADEMKKRIVEAEPYSQLFVELQNSEGEFVTLERSLAGGSIALHQGRLSEVKDGAGETIAPKRTGTSKAKDVTEALLSFAGIEEARLRRNDRGETSRLTIRTMLPFFLVDEVTIIDERSPVLGRAAYDTTARKRAFAYVLSGKDDTGIVASEKREIITARLQAQLSIVSDLLAPIEQRLQNRPAQNADDSIERVGDAIAAVSTFLSDRTEERATLEAERREAFAAAQRAESQLLAIDELLKQYSLLGDRYRTDLERLDFIAEGAHFFNGLQEVRCPLCDQLMSADHAHKVSESGAAVYQSARAEAAKILAHQSDLQEATKTLRALRSARERERREGHDAMRRIDARIASIVAPAVQDVTARLDQLVERRLLLEAVRNDETQASDLRLLKEEIESAAGDGTQASHVWEPLPGTALRSFCAEVEAVLKEWKWEGEGRVEFDESEYDIKVDGQPRQSHGKGVRAILYSAFVIGLLRYCHTNGRPHLGLVVLDSPLTSYKKGKAVGDDDGPVSAGMEDAFWHSLRSVKTGIQLIVIENKEPPAGVARAVHFDWFAGKDAQAGERKGYIPTN